MTDFETFSMKMIDGIVIGFLLAYLTGSVVIAGVITHEHSDFSERQERHLKTIARYSADSSPEAIEKLGGILGRLSNDGEPELRESQAFKLARARLLEIPGFAEHYKQKILATSAWENGESTVQMSANRGLFFRILRQLPHPETVRVLGELLYDDRGYTKDALSDSPYVPNSVNAAYALRNIGLQKPPAGSRNGDAWEEVPTWRLWFEQVQHGKAFSFDGDAKTYTLFAKSEAGSARQERRPKLEGRYGVPHPNYVTGKQKWLTILGLLLVVVLIASSRFIRKSG